MKRKVNIGLFSKHPFTISSNFKRYMRYIMLETDMTKFFERKKLEKEIKQFLSTGESESISKAAGQMAGHIMKYECAIKEVQTKLEILNMDLDIRHGRKSIEFITSRVKEPQSIINKMHRYELPISVDSISKIFDIAGIRVICSFIDDIYEVADLLIHQDDVTLIKTKDYIKNPKLNGYRSLHLIVEIPVFFADKKEMLPVEVQIRTIAMDFWASLEHQLKYKKDIPNESEIVKELKECASVIARTDMQMQEIRNKIM